MENEDLFYGEKEPEKKDAPQRNDQYGGYPPYGNYSQPPKKTGNGLGIASLVTGIISICCCLCPYIGLFCAVAGIITAVLARKQGNNDAIPIMGLVISITGLIINVFLIIYIVYVMMNPTLYRELMEEYNRILESMEDAGYFLRLFRK